MRTYTPPPHIEDVTEPFNGCRRKNMVPLSEAFPEIATLWHYKKNCGWGPEDFSSGSQTIVWWKCPKGKDHEWKTSIACKTGKGGTGCPFCRGLQVGKDNSLQALHPDIADQWHPKKNGKLLPTDVSSHSNKKVWWLCNKSPDHEWQAAVHSVQRSQSNKGCPFCSGKKVSPTNSLKVLYPKLAKEWHPSKNGNLKPNDITFGSAKKVWWRCNKGHSWVATVGERTRTQSTGCPTCYTVKNNDRLREIGAKKWKT